MLPENKTVLFLIRKNPDTIGGIQRHNARLLAGLSGSFQIERVIWRGPEWGAPFYFPLFYFKTARNGAGLIHCDDAVTAIIGSALKKNTGKKAVATVHGLDVILPIQLYQNILSRALKRLDRVICVSKATARQVEIRGVSKEKIEIIPNSAEKVRVVLPKNKSVLDKIRNLTGINLEGKKVLFSLGRPLRRKGFDCFIRNVFVHLPEDFVYIVAGSLQKSPLWLKAAAPFIKEETRRKLLIASGCDSISDELEKLSRMPRVYYLKTISEELRELLYVASTGIEGITDAVVQGENGFCIEEGDDAETIKTIIALTDDAGELRTFGEKTRAFTEKRFAPEAVYVRYEKIFDELLNKS